MLETKGQENPSRQRKTKGIDIEQIKEGVFTTSVSGSASSLYSAELHINHLQKSTYNCPHADGLENEKE